MALIENTVSVLISHVIFAVIAIKVMDCPIDEGN